MCIDPCYGLTFAWTVLSGNPRFPSSVYISTTASTSYGKDSDSTQQQISSVTKLETCFHQPEHRNTVRRKFPSSTRYRRLVRENDKLSGKCVILHERYKR